MESFTLNTPARYLTGARELLEFLRPELKNGKSLQSFGRKETLRCKPCNEKERTPVLVDELFHAVDAQKDWCFTVDDSGWTNRSDLRGLQYPQSTHLINN